MKNWKIVATLVLISHLFIHYIIERDFHIFDISLYIIIIFLFFGIDRQYKNMMYFNKNSRNIQHNLKELIDNIDAVIWSNDYSSNNSNIISSGIEKIYGYKIEDFFKQRNLWTKIAHKDDRAKLQQIMKATRNGNPNELEYRICKPNGEVHWVRVLLTPIMDTDGKLLKINGLTIDITAQKELELELIQNKKQFKHMLEACPVPIIIQQDNQILFSNSAAVDTLYMTTTESLLSKSFLDFIHKEDYDSTLERINEVLKKSKVDKKEERMIRNDGVTIYTESNMVKTTYQDKVAVMIVFSDITLRKNSDIIIHKMAYHDGLTGLPNRYQLLENLKKLISKVKNNEHTIALMFIDLDRFKSINDSLGHKNGDLLLKLSSERLMRIIRKNDTIYRYGGDEFIIVLENIDEDAISILAERILFAFKESFDLENNETFISPSIGISFYPEDADTIDNLINHADSAMYLVKEKGKNNFYFYKDINIS